MTLHIRDVPDDVRGDLARRAQQAGRSSQALLLAVVVREASFVRNAALVAEVPQWTTETGVTGDDALAALGAGRSQRRALAERDAAILAATTDDPDDLDALAAWAATQPTDLD